MIVEIDEYIFERRKYNRSLSRGVWVVGAVERSQNRRIILNPVDKKKNRYFDKFPCKYYKQKN